MDPTDIKSAHVNRKQNYSKVKEYHNQYLNPKTGYFFDHLVENRKCPVCNSSRKAKIFDKSGGVYVKCDLCKMIYLDPVFKDSALTEYYRALNTGQGDIVANESEFYTKIYTLGLERIKEFKSGGDVLDIGCSTGFFLDIMRKNGWGTTGVELGVTEAGICEKKGHKVYVEGLENVSFNKKFDVVTLWDVFEHIKEPTKYLKAISRILKKTGIIFIQTPNSQSIAARIMHEKCNVFDGVEHVSLYCPETLMLVAKKANYKIKNITTVISEISVLNNHLAYENPYFGSFSKSCLFDLIDENIICKKLLGYKMQAILKI